MSNLILPENKLLTANPAKLWLPDEKWAPLYYTKPLGGLSRGEDIIDFAESAMTLLDQPVRLTAWQRWVINLMLEEKDDGYLRYRRFLLGLPRKNGKSLIGSSLALEFLLYGNERTQIFSAAKDREQAKIVFKEAVGQIKKSRMLSRHLKPYRDVIENTSTGATYKAASSDAMSFNGYNPYAVFCDEVHGWTTGQAEDFWAAANEGSGNLKESIVVALSTAGKNLDSLLGTLFEHGKKIIESENSPNGLLDKSFGMAWWGAPDEADIFDENVWYSANPNLSIGLLEVQELRDSLAMAASTGDLNQFKRYKLNQWTRTDGNQMYIMPFHWKQAEKLGEDFKPGEKIVVGMDGSVSEDSTGFVGIGVESGLIKLLKYWERDYNNPEWVVPRDEVLAAQKEIFEKYDVVEMWCDPAFFQTDVDRWGREYRGKVKRIPQSTSRMAPMTQQLKVDLTSGEVFHDGNPLLRKHFMNAVQDDQGRIYKEARGSKNKIDFAVCAVLANGARNKILRRSATTTGRGIFL